MLSGSAYGAARVAELRNSARKLQRQITQNFPEDANPEIWKLLQEAADFLRQRRYVAAEQTLQTLQERLSAETNG